MQLVVSKQENVSEVRTKGSALQKAMLVLEAVVASEHAVSLAELTEAIDMPKQSIHRVLQSLVQSGLIVRGINKDRYRVGTKLSEISARALRSLNNHIPLKRILSKLVDATGETCNVGVLEQGEVIYIERLEGSFPLRLQLDVGSRVPFHSTAIGKLLVAHVHKNIRTRLLRITELQKFTPQTKITAAELEKEFSVIRASGWSFNNEEYAEGQSALAVPLRSSDGKVAAGLAIHGPASRLNRNTALSFLPLMLETADSIENVWGLEHD